MKHSLFLLSLLLPFLFQVLSVQARTLTQTPPRTISRTLTRTLPQTLTQTLPRTLSGTVFDLSTGEAIPGVLVLLDGTSTHTVTDADGKFTLTPRSVINTSLVLSHMSYKTLAFPKPFSELPERIGMETKPYHIDAVTVYPIPFSRDELMAVFRELFLGTTRAGLSCRIENEDDIQFALDPGNKVLTAYSDAPLRVRNRFLGYDMTFNLMEFRVNLSTIHVLTTKGCVFQFYGSSAYTDLREGRRRFERRRAEVYENSMRAFFVDLAWKPHQESDFVYFRDRASTEQLDIRRLPVTISDSMSMKLLTLNTTPTIMRLNNNVNAKVWYHVEIGNVSRAKDGPSIIYFLDGRLMVDRFGNLDNSLSVMTNEGVWGYQRLGDMLPLDFEPHL